MEKQILAQHYSYRDSDNDDTVNAAAPLLQGYRPAPMSDKAIEAGYGVPAATASAAAADAQTLPAANLPRRSPLLTRLRTRWAFTSKRTRYTTYLALVAVLVVLAIGLGAGLGVRAAHNDAPSSATGTTHTGDLTWYDPGLGACGRTNTAKDSIVAVSHVLFDAAQTGGNPNNNPLCGKKIRVSKGGKHVDVTVVDRCVGCKQWDLDVTSSAFSKLADTGVGRTTMTWQYL